MRMSALLVAYNEHSDGKPQYFWFGGKIRDKVKVLPIPVLSQKSIVGSVC